MSKKCDRPSAREEHNYQLHFGLPPVADSIKKRKINLIHKISTTCNVLCKLFVSTALYEVNTLKWYAYS